LAWAKGGPIGIASRVWADDWDCYRDEPALLFTRADWLAARSVRRLPLLEQQQSREMIQGVALRRLEACPD